MLVKLTINKTDIFVETDKMHESWIAHCLQYGVRRFINDTNSGYTKEDAPIKVEMCQALAKDMQSGSAMPEKVRRSSGAPSGDPVAQLAFRNARAALTAIFKQVTGQAKAIDFAKHEKVAPFFTVADGKATWNDETVKAWMDKQAADGKTDYMAEAQATIAMGQGEVTDLDF